MTRIVLTTEIDDCGLEQWIAEREALMGAAAGEAMVISMTKMPDGTTVFEIERQCPVS